MPKHQENTFLALFLGVVKVRPMAMLKLWMEPGLIIRNRREDALPVVQIFTMLLILWAGICRNQEGDWASKCQIQKTNILHIMRDMGALNDDPLEKNHGY